MKSVCGTFRPSLANFENGKVDQFFKFLLKEILDLTAVVEELSPFSKE